jgi:hypothetical protein
MNLYIFLAIALPLLQIFCFLSLILIRKRKQEIEILEMKIDAIMIWLGKNESDVLATLLSQINKNYVKALRKTITQLEEKEKEVQDETN